MRESRFIKSGMDKRKGKKHIIRNVTYKGQRIIDKGKRIINISRNIINISKKNGK